MCQRPRVRNGCGQQNHHEQDTQENSKMDTQGIEPWTSRKQISKMRSVRATTVPSARGGYAVHLHHEPMRLEQLVGEHNFKDTGLSTLHLETRHRLIGFLGKRVI